MCGIFGQSINHEFDSEAARRALDSLAHRGPDQSGEWRDDRFYLGHRRLSILDLSENGRQPMEAGGMILIANGEIWNHQALRKELEPAYEFVSSSDSEVLLHGYRAWGWEGLLRRIDGMFAFALYDTHQKRLYIARDRFGVKPLYYAKTERGFAFASEVKALFEWDESLRCFSKSGIRDWLLYRGSLSGLTPYHGVKRLLSGHDVVIENGGFKISQYYDVLDQFGKAPSNPAELPERLKAAVEKRLMGDVPIGVQLSGGVDSSLVTAVMSDLNQSRNLNSFSIGFSDEDESHLSEEPYARYVADKLGTAHHQINIRRRDLKDDFDHMLWLSDGMLDFPNAFAIHRLSQFAKDKVTVQLTGEGADELFAGYTKFKKMAALENATPLWRGLPDFPESLSPKIARALYLRKHYGAKEHDILNALNSYIPRATVEALFGPHEGRLIDGVDAQKLRPLTFRQKLIAMDHKTYLIALLERQDKASMGAGIEARVPFLDRNLIEWAVNLPQRDLYDRYQTKKLLKDYAAKRFNPDFAYRKKVGFPMPLGRWMKAEDGLKSWHDKVRDGSFVLHDEVKAYDHTPKGPEYRLLNYADPQSRWVDYFLMVLRGAQEVFKIKEVKP